MILHKILFPIPVVVMVVIVALSSCNSNPDTVPFPEKDMGYAQPVTVPLKLSAPRKITWDTVERGRIRPVTKKLDIDALPSIPFNQGGFHPFLKFPETHFDFNNLPEKTFNLDSIKSQSFHFKTQVLPAPVITKAAPIVPRAGTTLALYDIGVAQGMDGKNLTALFKDKHGFMWIACSKGLFRYDGEYMRLYPSSSRFISDIGEDARGRIWFVHENGISIIDEANGILKNSSEMGAPFPQLPRMITDDKGRIWISQIGGKGIAVIDPVTETYKRIGSNNGISGSDVWGVFQDEKKNIWVSTNDGGMNIINVAANKIKYLKRVNGLGSDSLRAITGNNNGIVYVATHICNIDAIDISKGSIQEFRLYEPSAHAIAYKLLCDNKGKVWIAMNNGVKIADPANGTTKYMGEADGIPQNFVLDLAKDNQNRIWLSPYFGSMFMVDQEAELVYPAGTRSMSTIMEDAQGKIWIGAASSVDGISIVDDEKKVEKKLNRDNGLGDNFIQTISEVNGNMWVVTNGGFDLIDLNRKTIEHMGKKEGLTNDTIYGITEDNRKNIWLIGPSAGVNRIDSAKSMILHAGVDQGLSQDNIIDIKPDKWGNIWIATAGMGVDIIDPGNNTVQNLRDAPGLKDTCNRTLLADDYGRMWIGTDKGVYLADIKQNTLTAITTAEGLSDNFITSILSYKGSIYAGAHRKVTIITPPYVNTAGIKIGDTTWRVALLAKSDGLINNSNNWATNIITKNGKYLWGDAGVTIINELKEERDSSSTFITGISVMNRQQNFINENELKGGDTLFAGDTFFVRGQKPVYAGYSADERLSWDSVSGPYNLPANLAIPYTMNYVQFQFAQTGAGRLEKTLYTYVLEGIDKNWSSPTTNTFTENYLNLPPGNYIFKVSSKGISDKWSAPATLSFTITPPWYKTWWAYTLLVLLALAILRAYIAYRSRRLKRENRVLEEKVILRTKQLQQSIEDLKATQTQLVQSEKMASLGELTAGIAHEIQNPLNFVNNFAEVSVELANELKEELNKIEIPAEQKVNLEDIVDDIVQNQEKINFHGKRADSIVKGMLQHSRSSSGHKELTDINALADEYFRLSYHGLRAKDKSFNAMMQTDFDKSLKPVNVVPQDIGRAVLNLFTNAFYSVSQKKALIPNGYEPTVYVSTKKLANKIEIRVKDNGMGVPQKVLDKIFQPFFTTKPAGKGTGLGLSLSYDIITKAHGGEMKVETKEGEGAEFIILLPV